MAEAAEAGVAMHYLNFLSDYDIPKYWKEGEDRWHCRFPINDEERNMVHFEAVRQIVNSCTTFVGMGDYDDLVATVNELSGELVDVALNSSWLGEEEVADHGNVVWHFGDAGRPRPVE